MSKKCPKWVYVSTHIRYTLLFLYENFIKKHNPASRRCVPREGGIYRPGGYLGNCERFIFGDPNGRKRPFTGRTHCFAIFVHFFVVAKKATKFRMWHIYNTIIIVELRRRQKCNLGGFRGGDRRGQDACFLQKKIVHKLFIANGL